MSGRSLRSRKTGSRNPVFGLRCSLGLGLRNIENGLVAEAQVDSGGPGEFGQFCIEDAGEPVELFVQLTSAEHDASRDVGQA